MKKIILLIVILFVFQTKMINSQCGWQKILNGYEYANFNSVYFPCVDTGYVIGGIDNHNNYTNIILRTTNCGLNWTSYQGVLPVTSQTGLSSVYFTSAKTGYIISSHYDTTGIYGSLGSVIKTTNAGESWYNIYNETSERSTLREIKFANDNTGFITCNMPYKYLKTTNAGATWDSLSVSGSQDFVFHFIFANSSTGFITGMINTMFKITTNSGASWENRSSYLSDFFETGKAFFPNPNTGYLYAIGNTTGKCLIKTTNAGYNWQVIQNLQGDTLNLVVFDPYFTDINTGYYLGNYYRNYSETAYILQTTNGGINFHNQLEGKSFSFLSAITFINPVTGFAVGDSGLILKTTNGGGSYSISGLVRYSDNNQPVNGGYVKAIKLDKSTGNIITLDSVQIQSNGSYMLTHVPQDSVDIGVYPNSGSQTDWVMTYYPSTIYWQNAATIYPTENLTNVNIGAIRLVSSSSLNSINGKIMTLTDSPLSGIRDANLYAKSGNTFVRFGITDVNGVYHLSSLPPGNIKIIVSRLGYNGDSATVSLGSTETKDSVNFYLNRTPVFVKQTWNIVPSEYRLYQNYPNPFNPTTKIKYQISNNKLVLLKVYDLLGREVAELVNEKQAPGVYEISFDAGNLPSGIYFYKLETGSYLETKKMVLIK